MASTIQQPLVYSSEKPNKNISKPIILDIRQTTEDTEINLKSQVIDCLTGSISEIPPLILWNSDGQKLFDEYSQTKEYYPTAKELEILASSADDIAAHIPPKSVIIELGCGTLRKTGLILSAVQRQEKQASYYALDVSLTSLDEALGQFRELMGVSSTVGIRGLHGSYEDCISWLKRKPVAFEFTSSITFLWMGNSIGNMDPREASSLLNSFCAACECSNLSCNFILTADGCQKMDRINECYSPENGKACAFVLNGLKAANKAVEEETFDLKDWACSTTFDATNSLLRVYCVAQRDVNLMFQSNTVTLQEGHRILAIKSGKWTQEKVGLISREAGLQIKAAWKDIDDIYGFYFLSMPLSQRIE